jgi:ketopantoate reductase
VDRQRSANYFISALLAATSLRTRCVSADLLLFYRLRDLAVASVFDPSTVRYNCNNGGLLVNEGRVAHIESRLKEATRVVQAYRPGLKYEYLAE